MRIAVLGPLDVLGDDGETVEVPGAKERLLLAVLTAGAPGVVSTDLLAESLWDGDPPVSARKSLQAHVVRLRSALEPGRPKGSSGRWVLRRGAGYALAVGRSDVDALLIGDRAARGHALLAAGDHAGAERDLGSALLLWRGDPYVDWADAPFAEPERRRLQEVRAGALAGLLEARLQLGRHAEVLPELERLVTEDPLREDWWRLLLLSLYRAGRQADALAAARRVRALLAEELGTSPGPALRALESAILTQDPALDPPAPVRAALGREEAVPDAGRSGACPYKGLAAYQVDDAPLFHGRRRLVSALAARLVDAPLVVVSGPSGAGKSSVVRAGLVPALADGALPGSGGWSPVLLTPGRRPVDALAPLTGENPPTAPVLLVCDQFEEVWGPEVEPAERTAFLDTVLGLLDDGVVVRCVLVVRGDHVGRLAEHPALAERAGGALVLVPPLTDGELREIVQEPARAAGLTAEPDLLDAVVADGLGRPGALPLLSTALVGTWERRSGDVLTLAGYLRSGGVAGALTRSAETAYGALDDEGRETARRLLVRLADVDDGGSLVRRRVPLAELDLDGEGGARRRAVVETFVDRRLLSVDAERLEVTHEALLTAWPRLARWLEDDAAGRAVRRYLAPAAQEWAAAGRPDDELYRGARLAAALDWADRADADPTPVERQFLDASRERAERELQDAHARAEREAAARRRTRRLAAGLAAVLVVALVATGLAVRSLRDAREASVRADASRLANLATTTGAADVALLLAVEAVRLADVPETRSALLGALVGRGRMVRTAPLPERLRHVEATGSGTVFLAGEGTSALAWSATGGDVRHLVDPEEPWYGSAQWDASPRGALLLGVGTRPDGRPWIGQRTADGTVRVLADGEQLAGRPGDAAFTDDERTVVALMTDREPSAPAPGRPSTWRLVEVDASDGSLREVGAAGVVPGGDETWMEVAGGARTALVAGWGPVPGATLIDVASGRQDPLRIPARTVGTHGFRTLPSGAAQLWADGEVTLYGRDGLVRQRLDGGNVRVTDVVESPDGAWGATVGADGTVTLWDADPDTGLWTSRERWVGHAGDVVDADVDPDGQRLATVGVDDRVVLWDVAPDGGFGTAVPGLAGRSVTAPPQVVEPGRLAVASTVPAGVTVQDVGAVLPEPVPVTATFFHPTTGQLLGEVDVGNALPGGAAPSVSVSPDRALVAVSTGSAVTVLEAATRRALGRYPAPPVSVGPGLPEAGYVPCLTWTPEPSRLLVCVRDEDQPVLAEVDPRTGERVERTTLDVGPYVVGTSPDGRLLAAAGGSGGQASVLVLDARTLEIERFTSFPRAGTPSSLSFSPDGRWIAVTDPAGLVLIDTGTWQAVPAPPPLTGQLLQAEWFPDSRTVAVAGPDRTAYLFDVGQGQVRPLPLPASEDGAVGDVHLVPAISDELVVLSGDRSGRRYPLDPVAWSARACEVVGRDLTEEEWTRNLPDRPYRPTCGDLG